MRTKEIKTWVFITIVFSYGLASCGGEDWSRADQRKLIERCRAEGGSSSYCKCYLKNAMKTYPNAADMETIDFETAVELSLGCE